MEEVVGMHGLFGLEQGLKIAIPTKYVHDRK